MIYLRINGVGESEELNEAELTDEVREEVLNGDCDIFKLGEDGKFLVLDVTEPEEGKYSDNWLNV